MPDTVPACLHATARTRPNAIAYRHKVDGAWLETTWGQYLEEVRQAAKALIALGLEPGDKTAILGFNRPEWVIFHVGSMTSATIPSGIYTTNAPSEVQYIVSHAEVQVILLEDMGQWTKVRRTYAQTPSLRHAVMMRGAALPDDIPDGLTVHSWEAFMAVGAKVDDETLNVRMEALTPEDIGTFIYTSGTTGPPKAVMLSHDNLVWTSAAMLELWNITSEDELLSYLPLSHIAEQSFTIHAAANGGYTVNYAESPEKIADNLKEVRPTVIFGVPRVWERFYQGLSTRLQEATGTKAKLAGWAQDVGAKVTALRNQGEEPGGMLALKYKLANKLVLSKIKVALGLDRAHALASGAAPISPRILEFFAGLDINIWEIYGQSEGSGPTTTNYENNTRYGTVGKAIPGCEVKLDEYGEILLKGRNVFPGYYRDPAANAATLKDGWLYSGDLGAFDADGYLTITGRKKDIIITSGGKNIAPKNIEAALMGIELVALAVVIGEGRRFITALLSPNEEAVVRFAEKNGTSIDDTSADPRLKAAIQAEIDRVNEDFARVEQVRQFYITPQPFSLEAGELTPTLKLKRQKIAEHYADEIEAMYAE